MGEVAEADPAVAVGVISSCKAEQKIPYRTACRALGVSESWFYKWRDRPPTAREARRQQLAEEIEEIFHGSGGTYGSPKVFIELVRGGWRVSVNTVAKVMAELGLAGRKVRRRRSLTRPGKRPAAVDFVRRDFTAEEPDLVWAGDLTEIETGEGKLYLATVIDLFSRRLTLHNLDVRTNARPGDRRVPPPRHDPVLEKLNQRRSRPSRSRRCPAHRSRSTATTLDLLNRAGAVSTATKVKILHPEWDDTAVRAEVRAILTETGADAPDPIQFRPLS
ncbi:IS3 family transposase [Streptomyces ureilyticus]|uniref:IS3 family transposase n=1 Tax=Streptomyces ureilyticus TaxID=1775131 RepID=A0ABX0E3Q9_9ACTN|nr:IS3 family transposase [Streptomyces ureilyticus]NGO47044.1 IS3 family transposase [Streptomyces ureilyticus]